MNSQSRERDSMAGRALWVVADQILSSLSNAGLAVVVATQVSSVDYGAFAIAFSLYGFAVATTQGLAGQVLSVKFARASELDHASASRTATGISLAASLLTGTVLAVAASFLDHSLSLILLVFAALLPGLLLQDTWRGVFISAAKPKAAFLNDATWVGVQIVLIFVLVRSEVHSVLAYVTAWGAAAACAALLGGRQARLIPSCKGFATWLRQHREVVLPAVASSFAVIGAGQLAFVMIAALGSLTDVGAVRGSQTLLGPVNILSYAATAFLVPEVARRDLSTQRLTTVALSCSAGLTIATLAWGSAFLLLPERVGFFLLGETWPGARATLPWMLVFSCLLGITSGAVLTMRAWNWGRYGFWTSAVLGPAILVFSAIGTKFGGATGAAMGFAGAAGLVTPLVWWLFSRVVQRGRRLD